MDGQYKKAAGAESREIIQFFPTITVSSIRKSLELYKKYDLQSGTNCSLSQIIHLHNTGVMPEEGVEGEPYFRIDEIIAIQVAGYESNHKKIFPDAVLLEYGWNRSDFEKSIRRNTRSLTSQQSENEEKPATKLKTDIEIYSESIRAISNDYPLLTSEEEVSLCNIMRGGSIHKTVKIREEIEFSRNKEIVNIYCQSNSLADWIYYLGHEVKIQNNGIIESIEKKRMSAKETLDKHNDFEWKVRYHLEEGAAVEFRVNYSTNLPNYIAARDEDPLGILNARKLKLNYRTKKAVEARQRMINSNLRLVLYTVNKYYEFPSPNKISNGHLALVEAVDTYNGKYRFSTHAGNCIRYGIKSRIAGGHLLSSESFGKMSGIINEISCALFQNLKRKPTVDEVHKQLQKQTTDKSLKKTSKNKVAAVLRIFESYTHSLNQPLDDTDYGGQMYGLMADNRFTDTETILTIKDAMELVDGLSPIPKEIIKRRFRLDGKEHMTLQSLGDTFDIHMETVRTIEKQTLESLLLKLTLPNVQEE